MYRVVVAADPNVETANEAAEALTSLPCAPEDIDVTILDVFEEFEVADAGGRVRSEDVFDPTNFSDGAVAVTKTLDRFDPVIRAEHGDPADRILSVARDLDADLIVMSGRKRSPTGKAVFGSVVQSVLLNTDRPVLVAMEDR